MVLFASLALAAATWVGALVVGNTRLSLAAEEGSLAVSTDLPLATCSKVLTAEFPWVRFACEPREDAREPATAPSSAAGAESLDTAREAE